MACYFALGKTADDVRDTLGIGKQTVCNEAKHRQMTAYPKISDLTEAWFESVYGGSDREVTLTTLALRRQASTVDTSDLHTRTHAAYSGGLREEVDAWAIQLLVNAKF